MEKGSQQLESFNVFSKLLELFYYRSTVELVVTFNSLSLRQPKSTGHGKAVQGCFITSFTFVELIKVLEFLICYACEGERDGGVSHLVEMLFTLL